MAFLGIDTSVTGRRWIGPAADLERRAEGLAQQASLPLPVARVLAERAVEPMDAWADDMVLAEGLHRFERHSIYRSGNNIHHHRPSLQSGFQDVFLQVQSVLLEPHLLENSKRCFVNIVFIGMYRLFFRFPVYRSYCRIIFQFLCFLCILVLLSIRLCFQ